MESKKEEEAKSIITFYPIDLFHEVCFIVPTNQRPRYDASLVIVITFSFVFSENIFIPPDEYR